MSIDPNCWQVKSIDSANFMVTPAGMTRNTKGIPMRWFDTIGALAIDFEVLSCCPRLDITTEFWVAYQKELCGTCRAMSDMKVLLSMLASARAKYEASYIHGIPGKGCDWVGSGTEALAIEQVQILIRYLRMARYPNELKQFYADERFLDLMVKLHHSDKETILRIVSPLLQDWSQNDQ